MLSRFRREVRVDTSLYHVLLTSVLVKLLVECFRSLQVFCGRSSNKWYIKLLEGVVAFAVVVVLAVLYQLGP
jgi:hypothetical protein